MFEEKVRHIRVSDMPEFVEDTYLAGGNLLFLSIPGIGKTEIIKATCKSLIDKYLRGDEKELAFQFFDGSGISEEGLMMPYVDATQASLEDGQVLQKDLIQPLKNILKWMKRNEESDSKMILFIDEFTSFAQATDQRTLMNLIQSGIMPDGSTFDPKRMMVVMAANPSSDMIGYEDYDGATNSIESAVITRGATMFVAPDLDAFVKWGESLNEDGRQNIHPYILSALRVDPQLFMSAPEDDIRVCNPRTLSKLSDYFFSQTRHGRKWSRLYMAALISDAVADAMASIIDDLDRVVGIQELFGTDKDESLNPTALEKFKALGEFEKYYVISMALNSGSEKDLVINFGRKNNVKKLLQLLKEGDVPPETLVSFGTALISAERRGIKSKLTQAKWLTDEDTNIMGYLREARQLTNMIS